jgi:hypothetical protein
VHELFCFFINSGVGLLVLYSFTMGIWYLIVYCVYILLFIFAGMYFGPLPMCIVSSFFFASHFLSLSLLPIIPEVVQWSSAFAPAPLCCPVYVAGTDHPHLLPAYGRAGYRVSPARPARIASQYCVSSTRPPRIASQHNVSPARPVTATRWHILSSASPKKRAYWAPDSGHIPV